MAYDTFQEHCDYEANAAYDYVSEAYGATARDCNDMAAEDAAIEAAEAAEEEAAFGPWGRAGSWVADDNSGYFDGDGFADMPF